MKIMIKLAIVMLLATPLTGCLGLFGADDAAPAGPTDSDLVQDKIGEKEQKRISALADTRPRSYSMEGQEMRAPVTLWYNDSVGTGANTAIEGKDDRGGTNYGSIIKSLDIASYLPPGQPAEVRIQLYWDQQEGKSMDFDIYVKVPGFRTEYFPKSEEFNWNIPTKTMTINTIGVAGADHFIGVEANNGRTTADVPFTVRLDFAYAKNVLTPYHAWEFTVPANASGIVVESDKVAGDETVLANFIIIDPNDQLVQFMEYNDIAIPTESVFIPLAGPGKYIFYAYDLRGGFFRLSTDAPLDDAVARPLPLTAEAVIASSSPAPGLVERDWGSPTAAGAVTPLTGGEEVPFTVDGAYPLRIHAFVDVSGSAGLQGMVQARITSTKGLVHDLQRIARYDDASGSIGYTGDEGQSNRFVAANVAKGAYTLTIVNDSNAQVGYMILTYKR